MIYLKMYFVNQFLLNFNIWKNCSPEHQTQIFTDWKEILYLSQKELEWFLYIISNSNNNCKEQLFSLLEECFQNNFSFENFELN